MLPSAQTSWAPQSFWPSNDLTSTSAFTNSGLQDPSETIALLDESANPAADWLIIPPTPGEDSSGLLAGTLGSSDALDNLFAPSNPSSQSNDVFQPPSSDPNALDFPDLQNTLDEMRNIMIQDNPNENDHECKLEKKPQCPLGKFAFCCLQGPPYRTLNKQDRRGLCYPCEFAPIFFCLLETGDDSLIENMNIG